MNNISSVVLTKNEENNIKTCIESLSFADEIIVVDDNSEDKTKAIARKLGVKVFTRSLKSNFADQRNFALEKANGKWVFFLDADEVVSKELTDEIIQITNNPFIRTEGFYIKRTDVMWGKKLNHGEVGGIKLLRLARNGAGKWKRSVHEYWDVVGRTKTLKNPIFHYPHQNLREFVSDLNWFSTLHAKENRKERKKSNLIKIIFWPKGHFLLNWIIKGGFLDGVHGFVVALLMSFHSFLAWSKLWIYQRSYKTD